MLEEQRPDPPVLPAMARAAAIRLLVPLLLALLLAVPRAEALSPALRGAGETAVACLADAPSEAAACLSAFLDSAEWREAAACALRGEGAAACLGVEFGLVGGCILAAGGSAEAAAGCLALRLVAREAAKCLTGGVMTPGGCLGPGHELRRWGRALADPDGAVARLRARWLPAGS